MRSLCAIGVHDRKPVYRWVPLWLSPYAYIGIACGIPIVHLARCKWQPVGWNCRRCGKQHREL